MPRIDVSPEEGSFIVQVLGQLPTASGAWPVMMKIRGQLEAQFSEKPADHPAPPTPPAPDA